LKALQLRFKLQQPLNWFTDESAAEDLLTRVTVDEEFGLDVLDYTPHHLRTLASQHEEADKVAADVNAILRLGGSAWEVTATGDADSFQLSRRAVGPIREAIEGVPASTRAHEHLVAAWNRLSGRDPDESGGYREAVRAVEAAAKPVILPKSDKATLGTMIAAVRDKPEKWQTTLGNIEDVRRLMEAVWTGQLDRHGTDDESIPLNVSPEQADAAFAICLNLVRLFAGGHVGPTS
jgi:hypothetical protein